MVDDSHGYERMAHHFLAARRDVGAEVVAEWARTLPPGAAVLELGCGPGGPISQALVHAGLAVHGVDASPTLLAAFRARFPGLPAQCASAESSDFFGRRFGGVVAWGLLFLLPPTAQERVLAKAARALEPGGKLLFTAPAQVCRWRDNLTDEESISLGAEGYRLILRDVGLEIVGEAEDEGQNHYYFAVNP